MVSVSGMAVTGVAVLNARDEDTVKDSGREGAEALHHMLRGQNQAGGRRQVATQVTEEPHTHQHATQTNTPHTECICVWNQCAHHDTLQVQWYWIATISHDRRQTDAPWLRA